MLAAAIDLLACQLTLKLTSECLALGDELGKTVEPSEPALLCLSESLYRWALRVRSP